jgi:hypothetical protein
MKSLTYRVLINLSYAELPTEAKQYVDRLVLETSKEPFASKILEGVYENVIKADDNDIECLLLSGAFIDADSNRKVGCFWRFKTAIFQFIFSILTGVAIPNLFKKNYCLFLQSLVIASYLVKEGYVILPLFGIRIKQETTKNNLQKE